MMLAMCFHWVVPLAGPLLFPPAEAAGMKGQAGREKEWIIFGNRSAEVRHD